MKISNYVRSLLPTFEKEDIIEDSRVVRAELNNVTIPAYAAAVEVLGKWKFKSKELENKFTQFSRLVQHKSNDNFIVAVHKGFVEIVKNFDTIEAQINKSFSADVSGMGLTYAKANLMQLSESVSFLSRYSRKFLNYIYICETAAVGDEGLNLIGSLTKAEIAWVDNHFLTFCTIFGILTESPDIVAKKIKEIPDVAVAGDNANLMEQTIGINKLDPFGFRLIPVVLNPIYHVRMLIAEYQGDRYKEAKEEKTLLELRLLNMRQILDKKPDAALEKEINYTQGRVQDLAYKIAKMETDYA